MERIHIGEEEINDQWLHSMRNTEKAARAGAVSGEPGYTPIPPAYDGPKKPIKTKKLEDKSLKEMMEWLEELKKKAQVEVDRLYAGDYLKGGPGSGIKGHTTAKKEVEHNSKTTKEDAGYQYAIKQVEAFENMVVSEPNEHSLVVDGIGKIIINKTTDEVDSVGFTSDDVLEIALSEDTIMTHNHPGGSSFSQGDLLFACKYNVTEMRVVDTKYTHVLRMKDGSPLKNKLYTDKIKPLYDGIRPLSYDSTLSKIIDNTLTVDDANAYHSHNIMVRVAKELSNLIVYKRTER